MNPNLGSEIAELTTVSLQNNEEFTQQSFLYYQNLVEQLLDLFMSFGNETNLRNILEKALLSVRKMTMSDAGSIYLIDRSAPVHTVCFEVSQNDSQPDRSLVNFAVPLNQDSIVGHVALTGEVINLSDVHDLPDNAEYRHHKTFDHDIEYHTRSVLAVPIFDSKRSTLGVLQLINRKNQNIVITPENVSMVTCAYSNLDTKILQAVVSQIAVYIERAQLLGQSFAP
ncbi:MAG: GAF domain-containing protein [Pseudanabaenaceae cyanobacterium bins.39]|nr:GAF domain-containing protein [Pseudanabaenaceae cyanobacterium bins.39]